MIVGNMLELSDAIRDYHDGTLFPSMVRPKSMLVHSLNVLEFVSVYLWALGVHDLS